MDTRKKGCIKREGLGTREKGWVQERRVDTGEKVPSEL